MRRGVSRGPGPYNYHALPCDSREAWTRGGEGEPKRSHGPGLEGKVVAWHGPMRLRGPSIRKKVGVVGAWRSQKALFSSLGGGGPSPAGPLSLGKRHGGPLRLFGGFAFFSGHLAWNNHLDAMQFT